MTSITIADLPNDVHRVLRARAVQHGCSVEAEIRRILEQAVRPECRLKLGSLLLSIAREAGELTDAESELFDALRDRGLPAVARAQTVRSSGRSEA